MKSSFKSLFIVMSLLAVQLNAAGPAQASTFHTDPSAVITVGSPELTVLRKELGGYPNYGIADAGADVLYSGESDSWTFDLTSVSLPGPIESAEVVVSLVADDHYVRPITDYVGTISVNGNKVFEGGFAALDVAHGAPYGTVFNNWKEVSFPISSVSSSSVTVSIANATSGYVYGDWIAMDTMKLRLYTALLVPVDVKPGSCDNPLNAASSGVTPVAIVGSQSLDVTSLDPASIKVQGVSPLWHSYEDVTRASSTCTTEGGDGTTDLVLHFDTQDLVHATKSVLGRELADGEKVSLKLTGKRKAYAGGAPIKGEDFVQIIRK